MLREAVTKMLGAQRPGPLEQDKFLSYEKLNLLRRKKGEKYRQAEPFPHIVIDDFLEPGVAEAVVQEFAAVDDSAWHRTDSSNELNLGFPICPPRMAPLYT